MWHLRGHEKGCCFMRETNKAECILFDSAGNIHVGLLKFFTVLHWPQETAKC